MKILVHVHDMRSKFASCLLYRVNTPLLITYFTVPPTSQRWTDEWCLCAVLLLYNSSSHLATQMQPLVGLSTASFSLVFELYVQALQRQTTTPLECSAGAKLILVLCQSKPNRPEVVLHLGINGTELSVIRQAPTALKRHKGFRQRRRLKSRRRKKLQFSNRDTTNFWQGKLRVLEISIMSSNFP